MLGEGDVAISQNTMPEKHMLPRSGFVKMAYFALAFSLAVR
jgi:hypothetical protein